MCKRYVQSMHGNCSGFLKFLVEVETSVSPQWVLASQDYYGLTHPWNGTLWRKCVFKSPRSALTAEAQKGSAYFDYIIDVVSCHRFLKRTPEHTKWDDSLNHEGKSLKNKWFLTHRAKTECSVTMSCHVRAFFITDWRWHRVGFWSEMTSFILHHKLSDNEEMRKITQLGLGIMTSRK